MWLIPQIARHFIDRMEVGGVVNRNDAAALRYPVDTIEVRGYILPVLGELGRGLGTAEEFKVGCHRRFSAKV